MFSQIQNDNNGLYLLCEFTTYSQDVPHNIQAFLTPFIATSYSDLSWFINTGATHHLTFDISHLQVASTYNGDAFIMLGTHFIISITYLDFISLFVGSYALSLKQLLCTLHLEKNPIKDILIISL